MLTFLDIVCGILCPDAGVVGGCADVCGILEEKTGSEIAGLVCNLLCDYVGITEFIKVIQE